MGIKVIPGVEISTTFQGKTIHILGYNIDVDNQDLLRFLNSNTDFRKKRFLDQFLILNENLKRAGKREADISKYREKDTKYYTKPGLTLFLYEEGIIGNQSEGFKYFEGIKHTVPPTTPQDAIEIIHKAGGKAVLSHPLAPRMSLKEISLTKSGQEKIISEFAKQGLDGLECYGTGHNKDDEDFCLQLSEKFNLIITAGSDWHGTLEQLGEDIKKYLPFYLGRLGDLKIPKESVQQIIKNLEKP